MDYAQKFSFCVEISNELNVPTLMTIEQMNEWIKTEGGRKFVISQLLNEQKSTITKLIAIEAADEADFVG